MGSDTSAPRPAVETDHHVAPPPTGLAGSLAARRRLGPLLALGLLSMSLGLLLKVPGCLGPDAPRACYSDIGAALRNEGFHTDRFPFIDACPPNASPYPCDEYPPLTMFLMKAVATAASTPRTFFLVNAIILLAAGLSLIAVVHRIDPGRSFLLAVAPTLAISGFLNWDLLAVAFSAAGVLAAIRRRPFLAGMLLGIGGALKLFPLIMVVPLAFHAWRTSRQRARTMVLTASATFLLPHLPLMVLAPDRWFTPYRFASERVADIDSLWHIACSRVSGELFCPWPPRMMNLVGSIALLAAIVVSLRLADKARTPAWSPFIPILAVLFIFSKVYSPQYSLWLLPWLILWTPSIGPLGTFLTADLLVGAIRTRWLIEYGIAIQAATGVALSSSANDAFHLALIVRAAVLVGIIATWITLTRRRAHEEALVQA